MMPFGDVVAKRNEPWVTWMVIALNVMIFMAQAALAPAQLDLFLSRFALIPAHFFNREAGSAGLLDYYPFLTNAFLHGGVIHLLFNMWALWVFGPAVEDRFGARKFLTYYLLTAFFASLAHATLNPASQIPALGASGAISGVIGAYVRMFPMSRLVMVVPILIFPFFFEISAAGFAAIWIIMQIIPGIASLMLPPDAGGVAWWAHLGGFAAGWLLTPVMRRPAPAYRRFFSDEGVYGFFPDGGRFRGGGVWR